MALVFLLLLLLISLFRFFSFRKKSLTFPLLFLYLLSYFLTLFVAQFFKHFLLSHIDVAFLGFSSFVLSVSSSGSAEKSWETLKALLSSPQDAPNLEEVSSLRAPREEQGSPSLPRPTAPSPLETPNPQAPHPGTAAPEASAAPPELSIPVSRNQSLESSLFQRVRALEDKDSIFIRWDKKGDYWNFVQATLKSQSTQLDYNFQLELESKDLQLRELRDQAASLLKGELSHHPEILNRSGETNPDETLFYFFNENTEKIDESRRNQNLPLRMRHITEMTQLNTMIQDLRENGDASSTFRSIVQDCFPPSP